MAVLAAPPRSLRHPSHGETATFLQASHESDGVRTILHLGIEPAGGEPLSRRAGYAKRVEVLEGTLTLHLADATRRLAPGEKAVVPAGIAHRLANDALEPLAVLVDVNPGHTGFERALMASYGLAADGLVSRRGVPLNPYFLATILEWSETRIPDASQDAVRRLALRARERGLDVALAERYCAW
jgi:mannose-6-phosphate isomerase-like protein (cupin superfamily)